MEGLFDMEGEVTKKKTASGVKGGLGCGEKWIGNRSSSCPWGSEFDVEEEAVIQGNGVGLV